MDENFRVIFYGADDFSVPGLYRLAQDYKLVGVITYDDRPSRRGESKVPTPVKSACIELGLNLIEVPRDKLQDEQLAEKISSLEPDLGVVISFTILPKRFIHIPRLGTINLHPSMLPRYRGAAPINWAIINGESRTGLTVFLIEEKVDAGKIVYQEEIEILENETSGELRERMKKIYPRILIDGIEKLRSPGFNPLPQNLDLVTFAPKIKAHHRKINWGDDGLRINNLIRGLSPVPSAFTIFRGKVVKVIRSKVARLCESKGAPCEILGVSKEDKGILVATGCGIIILTKLQPENRNIISGLDFWNGFRIKKGERFD